MNDSELHEFDRHPTSQPRGESNHHDGKVPITVAPGTGWKLAIGAIVVISLLAVGFGIAYAARARREHAAAELSTDATDAKPAVDVVTVRSTDSTYPLSLPGQTAGFYQSTIYARVDGYVGKWFSDIGDRVKAGQVLATIETPDLDQQLTASQARVSASAAQVKVAQANESIAKITFQRWWDSPKGVVSEQERQEKKSTHDSAVAKVSAAEAQQQLDQADVDRLKALQSFQKVVAPYDGVITGRHVDIGDLVTAGSTASTSSLYTIAQANVIRTFVDVPQKIAADMTDGLSAVLTSDQFPGREFRGRVTRSSRSIDPSSRTQRTEVDIQNEDLTLLPGMYVQVTFALNQRGLLRVPAAAILFKAEGLQVATVDARNKVEFRKVTVAQDDGETVELASGVKAGDRVALNISNDIAAGDDVTTVNVDAEHPTVTPPPPPPAPVMETIGHPTTTPHIVPGRSAEPTPPPMLPPPAGPNSTPASGAGTGGQP